MQFRSQSVVGWNWQFMGAALSLALGSSACALSEQGASEETGAEGRELGNEGALAGPFEITITPAAQNIDVNETAFYGVDVEPLEGFTGDVSLNVTSNPPFTGFVHMFDTIVTPPQFTELHAHGQCDTAPGTYNLTVVGTGDDGSTATAAVSLTVDPTTFPPPSASFFVDCESFTCQFFDFSGTSFCTDIVSRVWDFGDGTTSTEPSPVHTYAARGTYTVTLSVTDNQGLSDTIADDLTVFPPPPVLEIEAVARRKDKFEFRVDLTWSGAEGTFVELRRNNSIVDLPDNDGVYRDRFRSLETSFRWRVCELQVPFCSNEVFIDVGPGLNGLEATVTTEIDGKTIVERIPVQEE